MANKRLAFNLKTINLYLIGTLLFLLPFEVYPVITIHSIGVKPSHVIAIILVALNLVNVWQNRTKLLENPWIFLTLFLGIVGISLLYNGPNRSGLSTLGVYGFEFLLALVISLATKQADLKKFRDIILISGGLVTIFGLWQLIGDSFGISQSVTLLATRYTHSIFGYPRIHGLSFEPLFFSNYLFIPFCLSLISWLYEKRTWQYWLTTIFASTIFLTISRSAWIGLGLIFIISILVLVAQKRYKTTFKVISSFVLAIILASGLIISSTVIIRHAKRNEASQQVTVQQAQFVDSSNNTSTLARSTAWKISAKEIITHPLIGIGPSNIQKIIQTKLTPQQFINSGNSKANNLYLEIASEEGITGVLLLFVFITGVIWLVLRASKKTLSTEQAIWAYAICLMAAALLIQWNAVSNLAVTHTWIMLGVLLSIVGTSKIHLVEKIYRSIKNNLWLKKNKWALIVSVVVFAYYLLFELLLYRKFQFPVLDLGLFNRHMFGLIHYGLDANPLKGYNLLGDHAHFFLLPLVPFYYFWQDPQFLLFIQALFIVLSGWPIYLIAKKYTPNTKLAALWLLPYFVYFGFWSALAYPFHDSPAAVLPLAWALYFLLVSKNYRYLCLSLISLLLFREDMPLVVLMVGIYLMIIERKYWLGAVIGIAGSAYFFWVTKLWLPMLGPASYGYEKTQFGNSVIDLIRAAITKPLEVIKSFVNPSEKLKTMIAMLLSFGGFGIFALEIMILLLPLWFGRFLSTESWRWGPLEHYSVSQAPILAAAAIVGLYRVAIYLHKRYGFTKEKIFIMTIVTVTLVSLGINLLVGQKAILKPLAIKFYKLSPAEIGAKEISKIIPNQTSVGAQSAFPNLSSRKEIYNLPLPKGARPEYIVLSPDLEKWPFADGNAVMGYKSQLEQQGYSQFSEINNVFVLKKTNQ